MLPSYARYPPLAFIHHCQYVIEQYQKAQLTVNTVAVTSDAHVKLEPEIPQLPLLEVKVKPDPSHVSVQIERCFVAGLTRSCGSIRCASSSCIPGASTDQTAISGTASYSVKIPFPREATSARRRSSGRRLGSSSSSCGCSRSASLGKIFDARRWTVGL